MVLARTAPSHDMGRARMLFWIEVRYVGGSSEDIAMAVAGGQDVSDRAASVPGVVVLELYPGDVGRCEGPPGSSVMVRS